MLRQQTGRKIGYAWVSISDQIARVQHDFLKKHGCALIFTDDESGTLQERPKLVRALKALESGDTLVIWGNLIVWPVPYRICWI